MPGHRRRLRPALLAALFAVAAGSAVAAAEIDVSVRLPASAPAGEGALAAFLGEAAGGAPVAVVSRLGRSVVVRTTEAGYDYLASDDRFESVSAIEPERTATAAPAAAPGERVFSLRLRTGSVARRSLTAAAAAEATVTASMDAVAVALSPSLRTDRAGPGTLLVSALGADGREVAAVVIADPRLVRYETANAAGEFTESGLFYSTDVRLGVSLPDDPRIAAIAIAAPEDDTSGGLRRLATVPVR